LVLKFYFNNSVLLAKVFTASLEQDFFFSAPYNVGALSYRSLLLAFADIAVDAVDGFYIGFNDLVLFENLVGGRRRGGL